jgi:hypothetical protein
MTATTRPLEQSLVLVWLGTALVSAIEARGQGAALLRAAGITDGPAQALLVWGGVAADATVGLALWLRPGRASYIAALALMALMTAIATALHPTLWLDPLGPLLKNIPIAALLWHLLRDEQEKERNAP